MKKIRIYILSFIILSWAFACEDVLDEARPGSPTEDQFMDSEEKFEFLVAGTYQKLIFFYQGRNDFSHGLWLLPDDNLTLPFGKSLGYDNFSELNSNTAELQDYYQFAYQLINRANTALDFQKDENYGFLYEDQTLRNHHRGELLFLRGYMYLNLWSFFGDVPLNLERIREFENTIIGNSSNNAALDQAISDLQEASTLLGDAPLRQGGIWNETANGMLGKALMIRGSYTGNNADYTAALNAFNSINSRTLAVDYGENFREAGEFNDESLFEVQAGVNTNLNNAFLNNDNFAVVGTLGVTWLFFSNVYGDGETDPAWVRGEQFRPSTSFLATLDTNDARFPELVDLEVNEVRKYMNTPKTHGAGPDWGQGYNNPRILRYADILLLKAEAIIRTGGNVSEAIDIINQIRLRAGALAADDPNATTFVLRDGTQTDAAVVLDWIFDERRIELAFEESHRWWDMKRRHILGEIDLTAYSQDDWGSETEVSFSENNLLHPYPQSEIVLNPELTQNPGY